MSDQDISEWLLSLAARFLFAHGVDPSNIHAWIDRELQTARTTRVLNPLVMQGQTDFGDHKVKLEG